MPSESGDMKLLGNFSKLIRIGLDQSRLQPGKCRHKSAYVEHSKGNVPGGVTDIGTKEAPYKAAVNDRQEVFEGLARVVSGADAGVISDDVGH